MHWIFISFSHSSLIVFFSFLFSLFSILCSLFSFHVSLFLSLSNCGWLLKIQQIVSHELKIIMKSSEQVPMPKRFHNDNNIKLSLGIYTQIGFRFDENTSESGQKVAQIHKQIAKGWKMWAFIYFTVDIWSYEKLMKSKARVCSLLFWCFIKRLFQIQREKKVASASATNRSTKRGSSGVRRNEALDSAMKASRNNNTNEISMQLICFHHVFVLPLICAAQW